MKRLLKKLILFLTSLVTVCLIYSAFNYVDITNGCVIRVSHDILKGNRSGVFKAISKIKATDPELYSSLCKYVDNIYERRCILVGDAYPEIKFLDSPGCYLAGTKIIFINPMDGQDENTVIQRSNAISKYAKMSAEYWNGFNTE